MIETENRRRVRREEPKDPGGAKALPHSEESERAVLAAILLSPHVLPVVTARLEAEDFYLERHQLIFQCMLVLQEEGTEIDLRTLQGKLELRNAFDTVGGMAYLAGLDLDLPDLGRIESYVEIVKERSIRRRLIQAAQKITFDSFESGQEAQDVLAEAEKMVLGLGEEAIRRGFSVLGDVLEETVASLEERADGMIGLETGFYDWDRITQGLVAGNLIIIAGRPGMGKTSFAINVTQHVAIRGKRPAAIFSLEMGEQELAQRIMASESDLPFGNLRAGQLSEGQWTHLYETIRSIDHAPLYIDDTPNPTLVEIASKCRRLRAEHGIALLVVDYLQLMQAGGKYESRQLEIAAISRGLKQLAKELDIPVVALSQLSRQTERRAGDHRPQLADLRESGAIEQDADMVCFIYRDEIYNKDDPDVKGLAELIVAKHRNGQTGTIDLVFIGESTSFRNLDRVHETPGF
ncbi:MAG: replicative DNA helicase [Thermoanaerobaculia bacterium]|nr:replicative DNA helicase [Thermoanaerobaculia bacterium]